ncbi:MAG: hypothetical protein GX640_17455 [Fibrobacter sp.]|nr:hypothetical protein [Fibrobacter sp.]
MKQRVLTLSSEDRLVQQINSIQKIIIQLSHELHYRLQRKIHEPGVRNIAFFVTSVVLLKILFYSINEYRKDKKIHHLKLANSKLALENAMLRKKLSVCK